MSVGMSVGTVGSVGKYHRPYYYYYYVCSIYTLYIYILDYIATILNSRHVLVYYYLYGLQRAVSHFLMNERKYATEREVGN